MSGPTKRQDRPAKPVPPAAAPPEAPLTYDELRMLELFRATTDQQMLLGIAAVCVNFSPRHKRPVLHLVHGGMA